MHFEVSCRRANVFHATDCIGPGNEENPWTAKNGTRPPVENPDDFEAAERRLHHLHVAAENLHAAGLHEQAEHIMAEAEQMERELQAEQLRGELNELREHVEQLNAEVRELREQVERLSKRAK